MKHYDYIAIGGGSGGIATANRAAEYGARALIIEQDLVGGTCVNRGCVPKKVRWYGGVMKMALDHHAYGYGVSQVDYNFDYGELKKQADNYIERARASYFKGFEARGTELLKGKATFVDDHTVEVNGELYTADHITIATGAHPRMPNFEGAEYLDNSTDFFNWTELPGKIAVIGGGYIGTELSGLVAELGAETHFYIRGQRILANFDSYITDVVTRHLAQTGVNLHFGLSLSRVEKVEEGLLAHLSDGTTEVFDKIIWAAGIAPNTQNLGLENTHIALSPKGSILVDEYQNTNVPGLYAIGDVIDKVNLTPVAIAAGRRLSDRLFGGMEGRKLNYENIPSVVFTNPPMGSVGLTEEEARKRYDDVKVYAHKFTDIFSSLTPVRRQNRMKMVVQGPDEVVVGIHMAGDGVDESLQGYAVAVANGLTKAQFSDTVAIHPTTAEEVVTLR
ncbi:MAG: glutathione-disulfide reductase [Tissierellia bacterium]|nr:glutathione-disulfide reductase [Tissierellia bacterium]